MRTIIFGVVENGIELSVNTGKGRKRVLGKNPDEMNALWKKLKVTDDDIVMFSSSMDFPEDSTSSKAVLRMVQTVNGVFRATAAFSIRRKGQRR